MDVITVTFFQPTGLVLQTYRVQYQDAKDVQRIIELLRLRLRQHERN